MKNPRDFFSLACMASPSICLETPDGQRVLTNTIASLKVTFGSAIHFDSPGTSRDGVQPAFHDSAARPETTSTATP